MKYLLRYRYGILVLVILGFVAARFGLRGLGANPMEANFNRIEYGMTLDEVKDLLGEPAPRSTDDEKIWTSDWGFVFLTFKDGKVVTKEYVDTTVPRPRLHRRI
jgi:hypothetical protein